MTPRKKGGQAGNTNALKSGFYSNRFRLTELSDLDTKLKEGLQDEISLMRVMIRRLVDAADKDTEKNDLVATLDTLGAATTRLAGLIRTQEALAKRNDDLAEAISDALSEVMNAIRPSHS